MKRRHDNTGNFYRSILKYKWVIGIVVAVIISAGWLWRIAPTSDIPSDTAGPMTARDPAGAPEFLRRAFPDTDWRRYDPKLANAVDGGPGKDGIPALEDPDFVPIQEFQRADDIQAIVVRRDGTTKVYPYNILIWHEIVNDTIAGKEIAVTFCPLCGSAIVYDRNISDQGATTFGVSGGLLESNMIMYDRASQTLWLQSTGESLAGVHLGKQLDRLNFQLLNVGDVRSKYPDAEILSEDTGHSRNYGRNPYAGYEESEEYIFRPSTEDKRFPSKEIFVAFNVHGTPVAVPHSQLKRIDEETFEINGKTVTARQHDGEITILNQPGEKVPFYFEMWFSWAVQHQEDGEVVELP